MYQNIYMYINVYITPEQNDPQQQDGYRKDHPKDKLKEHAKETEQGVGRVGEQGRRRGGGGARIWERRKTEGGGLRAEGLVKGLATGRFARQLAQGLHFALGMLQHCELLPGDVEQIAVMKLLRGSGQGFLRSLVRHHARGVKERVWKARILNLGSRGQQSTEGAKEASHEMSLSIGAWSNSR